MSVIRVGFVFETLNNGWIGGLNYYLNLIKTVQMMPDSRIEIVIFTGNKVDLHGLETSTQVVRSNLFDNGALSRNFRKVIQKLLGKDLLLYALLKRHKIDCLSHSATLWKACTIPALPWIPDFQHKRLPQFFSPADIKKIDSKYDNWLQSANAILLSSYSAAKDLASYHPNMNVDINVLQFVSTPPSDWQPQEKSRLQELYQLPDKWFHVPNQLWVHKNHCIVIDALKNLKLRGINPTVLSTGNTVDIRNPDHFPALNQRVEEFGLEKTFRILGIIPYEDMLSLMYHSIAVINPSLFEGWSTTVEESKSMGKKILLSDIDVHIEQAPKRSLYFRSDDSTQLAELIEHTINDYDFKEEQQQIVLAKDEEKRRQQIFAQTYQDIIIKLTSKGKLSGK
jgi:glycosyltransferase involved in cell wall biosynthesis